MPEPDPQRQLDEATVDLLIKQAVEGLTPAEQRTLDAIESSLTAELSREFERAAAAVTLAATPVRESLPPALAERLARQADAHFATLRPGTAASAPVADLAAARAAAAERAAPAAPRARAMGTMGWVAAAACLVLALFGWLRTPPEPVLPPMVAEPPPAVVPPVEQPPAPPPTPAEARAALMAKSGSLKIALGATKDPAAVGVSGDVVWDADTQTGFVRFAGLKANDPSVHQYQIWIFDGGRDKRYPVTGGVFDVPADSSEVIIPIRAELMVLKPAAFAVTVEKPGGVVVSTKDHVVALGAVG